MIGSDSGQRVSWGKGSDDLPTGTVKDVVQVAQRKGAEPGFGRLLLSRVKVTTKVGVFPALR